MTDLTKEEALIAMTEGQKISHRYYSDNEYLTMDTDSNIRDESGYNMGKPHGEFWSLIQKWQSGWFIKQ